MNPLLVLIAHILRLAAPSSPGQAEATWAANTTLMRNTTTKFVTRYFTSASAPTLASLHPQVAHLLATRVVAPSLALFPNARVLPPRDEWPDVLVAFGALAHAGLASGLIPWDDEVPGWLWAVFAQSAEERVMRIDEVDEKVQELKASVNGIGEHEDELVDGLREAGGEKHTERGDVRGYGERRSSAEAMLVMVSACMMLVVMCVWWWRDLKTATIHQAEL
ncbi:hypothetical protein BCR44DRAFT_1428615 [Catenaria anguillulae PL171]|uniref:Uncharacterized protein n=1 Tax=Catenaria anguillulae PL171 TaxID=765915 RepID=A0A1Y2HY10_9FUNG|nr:hypothetical protein BCR44DRAFT_1428615 [Catenaria anguillulae PL171]